jgi:hypothetical protein
MPKTDQKAATTVTVREVTEQDRGDSWKLMTGIYVLSKKVASRPDKNIHLIKAGTNRCPSPRS